MEYFLRTCMLIGLVLVCISCAFCEETGRPCTYFGGVRVSAPQGNLINCSWYADNACCQRTEVTSVFGDMYPLYGASTACTNHLNYLMCYFCSPEQYKWYSGRARICRTYCAALYDECREAAYNGKSIGSMYTSGESFCRGQKFDVVDSNELCFDFDPAVFGRAPGLHSPHKTVLLACILTIVHFLYHHYSFSSQRRLF